MAISIFAHFGMNQEFRIRECEASRNALTDCHNEQKSKKPVRCEHQTGGTRIPE